MNILAFADAARPARSVILGLLMLDYSIGHEIILLRQRNELVCGGFEQLSEPGQRTAIIRAVLVCSRDWRQKPHRWLRLWGWMIRKADFALAVADFRNYRAAGTTFPNILPAKEESRELGSPFLARLIAFAGFNYDAPLGMLLWSFYAGAEAEGCCMVENETERQIRGQIRDEITQHEADYKNEQEAKCQR
jgi:hypothetical protein